MNIEGLGLQPGQILVSSGLAEARTWIPGQGEDLELTLSYGTSPNRESEAVHLNFISSKGKCPITHDKSSV